VAVITNAGFSLASVAETLREAKEYGFNINAADHSFNWKALKEKRDAYIRRLNGIYERNLENDKVDYLSGYASFVNKNTVKIQNGDKTTEVQAKKILIAAGKVLGQHVVSWSVRC
jgi:glutathione reductase (NADPH)